MLALAPTTLPDSEPGEYVRAALAARYDAIGLRLNRSPGLPFHPIVGNAPLIRELKAMLELPVLDIYSFYLRPETDLEDYLPALALGAELGARYAVVMGDDPDWARQRENFARICDAAAGFRLTCVVEFAVIRPLATLAQTVRLIAEAGRKNAAVCLDPLNFVRGGGKASDLKALDPALVPYLQLTDGFLDPGTGPNRRCLMGEGDVPMREILAALPGGLALSVEFPITIQKRLGPREWAKHVADTSRRYLSETP
jgi:sugar phosphate isomerase/epimerase